MTAALRPWSGGRGLHQGAWWPLLSETKPLASFYKQTLCADCPANSQSRRDTSSVLKGEPIATSPCQSPAVAVQYTLPT